MPPFKGSYTLLRFINASLLFVELSLCVFVGVVCEGFCVNYVALLFFYPITAYSFINVMYQWGSSKARVPGTTRFGVILHKRLYHAIIDLGGRTVGIVDTG